MRFDWKRFLAGRGIDFVERGPNVARGNININCPFCGASDEGQHLGISLSGKGWGCWRNQSHRGRTPHRLIMALTFCSSAEAEAIVGAGDDSPLTDDHRLLADVQKMVGSKEAAQAKEPEAALEWISEARPLIGNTHSGFASMFVNYLQERLYTPGQIKRLAKRYDLRYAVSGPFANRLIVPVYMPQGLVNWTGRAISKKAVVRYRTLSADPTKAAEDGLPVAPLSIEKTIFDYDRLLRDGGDMLIVAEGPFDGMRLDFFGYDRAIRGTCLFGKNLSEDQALLLESLAPRFRRKVLLLDQDATLDAISRVNRLEYFGYQARQMPYARKDPALLQEDQLQDLFAFLDPG